MTALSLLLLNCEQFIYSFFFFFGGWEEERSKHLVLQSFGISHGLAMGTTTTKKAAVVRAYRKLERKIEHKKHTHNIKHTHTSLQLPNRT